MNSRAEDLRNELLWEMERDMDSRGALQAELEDSLLAVDEMRRLPREARETLRGYVREMYGACMDELSDRIGYSENLLEILSEGPGRCWIDADGAGGN